MRIRNIKPEFWRSQDISDLPVSARLAFIGLWSYVDDNGVGWDNPTRIAADLFAADLAADPTHTLRRLGADLEHICSAGLAVRYASDQAPIRRLIYITGWDRHQYVRQPSKGSCYPLPPADMVSSARGLSRVCADPTQTLSTGTGGQGDRGTTCASSYVARDEARRDDSLPPLGAADDQERAADYRAAATARRRQELDARAELTRREIDACGLCDERGYRQGRVCSHDPGEDDRRARGIAQARAAIGTPGGE